MAYKITLLTAALVLMQLFHVVAQTPSPTVLWQEHFNEDGSSRWPVINHGDTATAGIVKGNYVLNNLHSSWYFALRLGAVDLGSAPQILEMKMKMTDHVKEDATYGIIWNVDKKSARVFDENSFLITTDGHFTIQRRENMGSAPIKEYTACACIRKDDYNVLRIEQVPGQPCRFYINDQLVHTATLPATNLASIGFFCDRRATLATDHIKFAVYNKN
ncbi:hypothetical protein F0L74_19100 [Chitinophaga agrisoli]|uniref:Uncharacterized protein n=1 Tax=Chitinophaga agrisoli TaxID=2607653 RepID=A0A5B2VSH1_9BACT|nr:hypothetical protein [Chitinophaga agrisoli]KAA2241965.1 hypothetical protein F0L74_19100 [Chitinophaga agrisoli]